MACRDLELLWREYFRDPSRFWDSRNSKATPRSPDFRHKQSWEPLWLHSHQNPHWVKEELRRCGLHSEADENARKTFQSRTALLELIKGCGKQKDLVKGSSLHANIRGQGLLKDDVTLGNALLSMYVKCGAIAKAQETFDELPQRNLVTWNALITGYVQNGLANEALKCYEWMREEDIAPNGVTLLCTLKACGSLVALEKGEEIHAEISRQGLLETEIMVGNALLDMYVKCGDFGKAQGLFDKLPSRNVVTWNTLISGFAQHRLGKVALDYFERMLNEGVSPDSITFICALKACGSLVDADKGQEIHSEVRKHGLSEKDAKIGTALVDMYAKCAQLSKAKEVFDGLKARNVVTWNALISGYVQHGQADEALCFFERMQDEGISPSEVTYICALNACGIAGASRKGEEIHLEAGRQGLLEQNNALRNAVVDMYAKCGELTKAQKVLNEHPVRSVATWTALMAGYAQIGNAKVVFDSYTRMTAEGVVPDAVAFVVLLTACSHAGLIDEAQMYFDIMTSVFKLSPTVEHRACMVDNFGRAGHFEKAISMVETVPPSDRLLLWSALIGACREGVNVEMGRWAFEHAVKLDEKFETGYIYMSNIYASASMQEEASEVEALRLKEQSGQFARPLLVD